MNTIKEMKEMIIQNLSTLPVGPARVLNGRGGRAPGFDDINIDLFPPLVFVTVYCKLSDDEISQINDVLKIIFVDNPILIQDRSVRPAVTRLQYGDIPTEMTIQEDKLKFFLNPLRGQNPGFFPDMRDGRKIIRDSVEKGIDNGIDDFRVLNLFAYTCSLSVVAIAAGASKVVNIDKNRRSLDIGRRNHRLNNDVIAGGYRNQAQFFPHDIFKSIGKLKKEGPYNLVIADPPPTQKGSFMLLKDYPKLIRRLPEMLLPGGEIILTHNGPGWSWDDFENMVRQSLPELSKMKRLPPPNDFAPAEEGRGLKILVVEL